MEHVYIPVINEFNKWKELTSFLETSGIGKAYSGVGIFKNKKGNILLRSVDGTKYYADIDNKYTLYGQIGNQDLEDKFNKHLLQNKKAYLYRVVKVNNKVIKYLWYGCVTFCKDDIESLIHPDINKNLRTIYRIPLKSI